jgi:chromate reductase
MHLIGISGSLRIQSRNTALLKAAVEVAPKDLSIELCSIAGIPLYNQDEHDADGIPTAVTQLADKILAADGLLIATPEYNFSIPGALKNTIDWLSRVPEPPFKRKATALMGTSVGRLGTINAQTHLRHSLGALDAPIMNQPFALIGNSGELFNGGDTGAILHDDATRDYLTEFMQAVAQWVAVFKRD